MLLIALAVAPVHADDPIATLPLSFAIAEVDGAPVVDQAWLDERVAQANLIFAPEQLAFSIAGTRPLAAAHARMETRADRHALGAEVQPEVVNCFIVDSLRDVDDPSQMRRGVHWHPRGYPGKHFVIVAAYAGPTVLAHELGHFFGNREHSDVVGNIMSYSRGEGVPFFDARQGETLRRTARRFLRSGELHEARDD